MKKSICYLAVVLCLGGNAIASESPGQFQLVGTQWVQKISDAYDQGQFTDLINRFEARYAQGVKNHDWDALREREQSLQSEVKSEVSKTELIERSNQFLEEHQKLLKKRNHALKKVAEKYPDVFVSHVINDLQWIPFEPVVLLEPEEAVTPSNEPDFSELDFKEGVFQSILCAAAYGEADRVEWGGVGKLSSEDGEFYFCVFGLYGFDQRLKQLPENEELKQFLQKARESFIKNVGVIHNQTLLASFAADTFQPCNKAEKKVAEIMRKYQKEHKKIVEKFNASSVPSSSPPRQ